jgi:hypothetical protein
MVAVLRDAGDAQAREAPRVRARHGFAVEAHGAGARPGQPGNERGERRLAVARDAGNADDLTFADGQARLGEGLAVITAEADAVEDEKVGAPRPWRPPARRHVAADHHLGDAPPVRRRSPSPAFRPRRTRCVCDGEDSPSLCEMKITARPPARRATVGIAVGLGRREHRRRLVEDEDAGVAVERLEDLDALALAHRQARHLDVEVDREPGLAHHRLDLPPRGAGSPVETEDRLGAEHDVLEAGKVLREREMLVDHAGGGAACERRPGQQRGHRSPATTTRPSRRRSSRRMFISVVLPAPFCQGAPAPRRGEGRVAVVGGTKRLVSPTVDDGRFARAPLDRRASRGSPRLAPSMRTGNPDRQPRS